MKRLTVFSAIVCFLIGNAYAAPVQRRGVGTSSGGNAAAAKPNAGAAAKTGATAARGGANAARAAAKPVAARGGGAPASGGGAKATVAARSATPSAGANKAVAGAKPQVARAGATQKVIGSGTKVAAATKNTVVSEECQKKYDGCMDAFCMIDNGNGGRCMCSNKNAEFDSILAEIEKLDQQSYQMATTGVEKIEMGSDADAVIANVNRVTESLKDGGDNKRKKRSLDLDLWKNAAEELDFDEDIFTLNTGSSIEGKTGDALQRAATELCTAQIPECSNELSMLQLLYQTKIKSDCTAYENSLKQQKNSSAQKLQAAEKALREAALEQHRSANKYDLGQCTIEFKKCMQTTAGCGEDFAECATVAAMDNTSTRKSTSKGVKKYAIKGASTNIEINASTYDTLISKKPLCETVTKQCVNVASQVWDTFLREVAPAVKSAELIAENNTRQNCIGTISDCFQKACKDTMDPNDPDGSYDMCLTRPGTMLNVCKIPLNNCGIDDSSEANADKSPIWQYVVARLASMRVDSCTKEFKECLTSPDRCGKDYSQCVGLDTDTVAHICPEEKLIACKAQYGKSNTTLSEDDDFYDELYKIAAGIMLNIDNKMLATCQNAANEAMLKVCGSTENCDNLLTDKDLGARALSLRICTGTNTCPYKNVAQIKDSDLGSDNARTMSKIDIRIDGQVLWGNLDPSQLVDDNANLTTLLGKIKHNVGDNANQTSLEANTALQGDLGSLLRNVQSAIQAIEADATVQQCMYGRVVSQTDSGGVKISRNTNASKKDDGTVFNKLTDQMRLIIANSAIKTAQDNYFKKYSELNKQAAQEYVNLAERVAKLNHQDALAARKNAAWASCLNMPGQRIMAKSNINKAKKSNDTTYNASDEDKPYSASSWVDNANDKETVVATFHPDTLICNVCVRHQGCDSSKEKKKKCNKWGDPVETCTDEQL